MSDEFGEIKKNIFCFRIFNLSPCGFTRISSVVSRWMKNQIPHPTSTHTTY